MLGFYPIEYAENSYGWGLILLEMLKKGTVGDFFKWNCWNKVLLEFYSINSIWSCNLWYNDYFFYFCCLFELPQHSFFSLNKNVNIITSISVFSIIISSINTVSTIFIFITSTTFFLFSSPSLMSLTLHLFRTLYWNILECFSFDI